MSLKFDEIVSVAGKGGLFKVLKPTKNGYIVEELGNSKKKIVLGPNHRVSLLSEISIYTTDTEGARPLKEVYNAIHKKYNKELPVSPKDDKDELFDFIKDIVPDFDPERVYHSDAKKLVSWYMQLMKEAPEISFEEEKDSKEKDSESGNKEKSASKKPSDIKPKANKTPKVNKATSNVKKGGAKPTANRKMG